MARSRQSSFAAGEITPALHARVDLEQYRSGVALAENWFVSVYGGLLNRPGTQFLDEVEGPSRLIPFQLGERQGYCLEWGDNILRFYQDGGRLLVQPVGCVVGPDIGTATGEWVDASSGGASIGYAPRVQQVPQIDGTAFGDLPLGGGVAAAFNGSTAQAADASAYALSYAGHIGKEWAAPKTIYGFVLYGTSDLGLTGRPQAVGVFLQGSNSGFTVDVTTLGLWQVSDAAGIVVGRFDGIDTTAAYTSHRIVITGSPSGSDTVAIAEIRFFDQNDLQSSIALIGAPGGQARAEQVLETDAPGVEHVLQLAVGGGPVVFQVGNTTGSPSIIPPRTLLPGWHLIPFTPGIEAFYIQFFHSGQDARNLVGVRIWGGDEVAELPLLLPQPYLIDDLPAVTWTQDANVLTLMHDRYPTLELRRGAEPLAWSLTYKRVQPSIDPPSTTLLGVAKLGSTAADTTHTYVVTYVADGGEESLPSAAIAAAGVGTLTATDYMRVTIGPLPAGIIACNVYKLYGGSYGLMGLCVAQFDDIGQAPKVDNPPPQARDPFAAADQYPACGAWWEQRLALAGSVSTPETVELSKPGLASNFGRSSPPRDDDAITFTPSGPNVRRIKHMVGVADLLIFTEGSVLVARRGESALTPALEGGVKQELARGIGPVAPLVIDRDVAFVGADARSVRLLNPEYAESDLSLTSEHLFRGRTVVDWCYAASPWSLLWLAMSDGKLLTLSLLPQHGVVGWARQTLDGEVGSLCAVREGAEDRVYMRVRRWLRSGWRQCIERVHVRSIEDVRDARFLDCGLSYDEPKPIVALGLFASATVTVSNAGMVAGDEFELAGTGIAELDNKRWRVAFQAGTSTYNVGLVGSETDEEESEADWSGLGPWRGGGVLRKAVSSVAGLGHLEGHAVTVLNDGSVEGPYTVTGGAVTLRRKGCRVHVGLAYESNGETLDIAEGAEGYGRRKKLQQVQMLLRDTRALEVGPNLSRMESYKPRTDELFGDPARPRTGLVEITLTGDWSLGGRMRFRQREPLPAEILSLTPVFERGG